MPSHDPAPIAASPDTLPRGRGRAFRMSNKGTPEGVTPEVMASALAIMQSFGSQIAQNLERQNESSALYSATIQIGADGTWSRNWQVQYRAVAVANLSPAPVTVATGAQGGSAPGRGPGTHVLLPGQAAVFAMSGNGLTVYGRAGDLVDVQVFTRAMAPSYAFIGTGGATPVGAYTYTGTAVTTETHAGMTTTYTADGSGNVTGIA